MLSPLQLSIFFYLFSIFLLTTAAKPTTNSSVPTVTPAAPSPHPPPKTTSSPHLPPSSPSLHSTPSSPSPDLAPSSPSPRASPSSSNSSAESPAESPKASPSSRTSPSPLSAPSTHGSASFLDPKQKLALDYLGVPTNKDPCAQPSLNNATVCDASSPFRHLVSLHMSNCSSDLSLSNTQLKALHTLQTLTFTDCPVTPIRFPSDLALSLRSFTCVNSLNRLSSLWLSRLVNLTELVVSVVPVNGKGLYVILGNMHKISSLSITNANLSGTIPKHLNADLTHIDLSGNNLKGGIPSTITVLKKLETLNLFSNSLEGVIPENIGYLNSLKNVSLGSNTLSGPIPDSMSTLSKLVHFDLSSNQFNGTVPKFLSQMRQLKYLNLENNQFHGVLPFNHSFISKLEVFKVGGNSDLCYNKTGFATKIKLGISPCDKHGRPLSPPPAKDTTGSNSDDMSDYADTSDSNGKTKHHKGPNKVTLGVSIALASIIFLIIFLILMSKKCCCC